LWLFYHFLDHVCAMSLFVLASKKQRRVFHYSLRFSLSCTQRHGECL
jgi:hypothetical protein